MLFLLKNPFKFKGCQSELILGQTIKPILKNDLQNKHFVGNNIAQIRLIASTAATVLLKKSKRDRDIINVEGHTSKYYYHHTQQQQQQIQQVARLQIKNCSALRVTTNYFHISNCSESRVINSQRVFYYTTDSNFATNTQNISRKKMVRSAIY